MIATNIRFNGVDYRSADLGKYLFVPSRDEYSSFQLNLPHCKGAVSAPLRLYFGLSDEGAVIADTYVAHV